MPAIETPNAADLNDLILRILDENRTMTIATLRSDGWPQATIVGFVHDDLTLYFAVSRNSQKLENIRRDPRTSIAMGHPVGGRSAVRGLSMAAHTDEVTDWHEVERLDALIRTRYPEIDVFAPRESNAAVLRARPQVVSIVDDQRGLAQPLLLNVAAHLDVSPASP